MALAALGAALRSGARSCSSAAAAGCPQRLPALLAGVQWPAAAVFQARAVSLGGRRPFSAAGYHPPEDDFVPGDAKKKLPDSWVEPEALWDYAQHEIDSRDVDDMFAADFGRRNEDWRQMMMKTEPNIFKEIGQGQAPKYLWIGCCDSRVAAENLINSKPGEIFVHRNIANMVVSTDTNLRAVLHYAVAYLKVEHIIVCGHYDCGGVKAAVTNQDHSAPLESWLTHIRDVYRLHAQELDAIINREERHKRLVELNVIEQCLNLFKTGDVQRRRSQTAGGSRAYPRIHAMVFEPSDGILRRLPIDWKYYLNKYKGVYQMYGAT